MRTHYSKELNPSMNGQKVKVAGWANDIRLLGNIAFINLRDRDGYIQLTFPKSKYPAFDQLKNITKESVLSAEGILKESNQAKNGFEILPERVEILSKSETPLPLDFSGKIQSEMETRLNSRFMDLRNPKVAAVFKVRDSLLSGIHTFMDEQGFIEVQTPKIVAAAAEGGATLFPVKYFEQQAYLTQSPQLFKQILMSSGLDRVYEIAPAFRAEKSNTTRHLSEFTSFDFELAFIDSMDDVLEMMENLITNTLKYVNANAKEQLDLLEIELKIPKTPFTRITFQETQKLLEKEGKTIVNDVDTEAEKMLGEIMAKKGSEFYFITHFPSEEKPFYIMENGEYCYSFDLDYKGEEMSSGGQREHRYPELVERIKKQGLKPKDFEFYLNAFKYGMPPHGGMGLGVERLVEKVLCLPNVREAVLFPRDRDRLVP
ncbi:aspartate--tRNA(Asn) ligase [archaeon]|nr:aspartate--tRNA(Asn) ligase [archaeon]